MKNFILMIIVSSSLMACSTTEEYITSLLEEDEISEIENDNGKAIVDVFQYPKSATSLSATDSYLAQPLQKNINFYVRGLMQGLVSNIEYVNATTPILVTSFTYLDGSNSEAGLLGIQISESLMHEIHRVGIPVLDHKVTDYIRVTERGDFMTSKEFRDLSADLPAKYVVLGNLVKHRGGYLVNARIVGISSKAVVASAQSFIPAGVANALLNSSKAKVSSMIPLIQGE